MKNRSTAALITVIVIIASIFGGSYRSIRGEINSAYRYFNGRPGGVAKSIMYDLNNKADAALRLAGLYEDYAGAGQGKSLADIANALKKAKSPAQAYELNAELDRRFKSARDALATLGPNGNDTRDIDNFSAVVRDANEKLSHSASEFNDKISVANKRVNAFPAFIFKNMLFIKDAEYFN